MQPDRETVQVVPVGELDLATVGRLRAEVEELVAAGFDRVTIDLRELVFIDCAGLRLLCELDFAAGRDGWRLALIQGSPAVRRVFVMTRTLDGLPFTPSSPPRRLRGTTTQSLAAPVLIARRGRRARGRR